LQENAIRPGSNSEIKHFQKKERMQVIMAVYTTVYYH
jgi:hypothetical protein